MIPPREAKILRSEPKHPQNYRGFHANMGKQIARREAFGYHEGSHPGTATAL
jgi:hypothetical protein